MESICFIFVVLRIVNIKKAIKIPPLGIDAAFSLQIGEVAFFIGPLTVLSSVRGVQLK